MKKIRTIIAAAVVAACLGAPLPAAADDWLLNSVVKLDCGSELCSGNIIGKNKVISAYHCIRKIKNVNKCRIVHRGKKYKIKAYRIANNIDPNVDIVSQDWLVLKVSKNFPKYVKPFKLPSRLDYFFTEPEATLGCEPSYPVQIVLVK